MQEVGSNVVATGSGTIDLTDLTHVATFLGSPASEMHPSNATLFSGPGSGGPVFLFAVTGPASFGSGGITLASSGTGDETGIGSDLLVPAGYVSGQALEGTSTYDNATFASLGVTPGTYEWTWGTGTDADSFTLDIGVAAVPEPASLTLLGMGLAGLGMVVRRRRA